MCLGSLEDPEKAIKSYYLKVSAKSVKRTDLLKQVKRSSTSYEDEN